MLYTVEIGRMLTSQIRCDDERHVHRTLKWHQIEMSATAAAAITTTVVVIAYIIV